jgi:hypothetical protein
VRFEGNHLRTISTYRGVDYCMSHVQGGWSGSHHFGPVTIPRDAGIQFTWKLFLRLAVLHINLYKFSLLYKCPDKILLKSCYFRLKKHPMC